MKIENKKNRENNHVQNVFSIIMLAVALSSCGTPQQKASALEENKEAKSLLEGIWLDDNTETALLRVKGDTLFYADAATAPVAFKNYRRFVDYVWCTD